MSYGGVTEGDVRDLVHGAIFTRGPKDLHNTAIFIGGTDMAAGERLLAAVQQDVLRPDARVGDARLERLEHHGRRGGGAHGQQAVGDLSGKRAVVTAGTGPVGMRAAGLLAKAGAEVTMTSRRAVDAGVSRRARPALRRRRARCRARRTPRRRPRRSRALKLLISAGPGRRVPDPARPPGPAERDFAPWPT